MTLRLKFNIPKPELNTGMLKPNIEFFIQVFSAPEKFSTVSQSNVHQNLKFGLCAFNPAAIPEFIQAHLTPMLLGAETQFIRP